jgi:hypothetical protein
MLKNFNFYTRGATDRARKRPAFSRGAQPINKVAQPSWLGEILLMEGKKPKG